MALSAAHREFLTSQLRRLYHAQRVLRDPASLSLKINQQLVREGWLQALIAQRFASEGKSAGEPWRPLARSTVAGRRRLGFAPDPILTRSGFLQAGAVGGKETADAKGITKVFKDGPAPRYIGGGQSRKRRGLASAAKANTFFGFSVARSNRLSDYAFALNAQRPFYGRPTPDELLPMLRRRQELIHQVLNAVRTGGTVGQVLG
ncbi:MAG: hypothetical protein HS116_18505 [Planctomycetes bacterium]|nr:hypothetical protein [Planctomycetota bacterium]